MKKLLPILGIGAVVLLVFGVKAASAQSTPFSASGKRGLRNNNPGNIKKSSTAWTGKVVPGTDPTFEQFTTMAYGLRALMKNIMSKISLHGLDTIPQLIGNETWGLSPASDGNDPVNYSKYLSEKTGIGLNSKLGLNSAFFLAPYISFVENGESESRAAGIAPASPLVEQAYNMI